MADIMDSTDWVKEFVTKMESEDVIQKYLEQRPPNNMPTETQEKMSKLYLEYE